MRTYQIKELLTDKITGEWGTEPIGDEGVKILRTTNFTNQGRLNFGKIVVRKIEPKKIEKKRLKKGDIIIEKSGGSPTQPVGRVVIFEENDEEIYLCNNFTTVLRPNQQLVDPKYLFYLLYKNHLLGHTLQFQNKTTGIINLKLDQYLDDIVDIEPDLAMQRRIATVLSRAEALITSRKQTLALLDDLLKSTFLDLFGDPVRNEKGWEVEKLSEYYSSKKEGTKCGPFGSALKKQDYVPDGIPVWVMDNIQIDRFNPNGALFITKEKYNSLKSYSVSTGDIIISRAGTVGKMCVVDSDVKESIISTNLIRLSLDKNRLLPIHFVSLMSYFKDRMARLKTGSDGGFTHMNTGVLNNLPIPVPPLELQTRFAGIVAQVERLKAQQRESLTQLEQLYQSLLQRAFRGELFGGSAVVGETPATRPARSSRAASTKPLRAAIRHRTNDQLPLSFDLPNQPTPTPDTPSLMKLLSLTLHDSFRSLPAGFHVQFLPDTVTSAELAFAPYCLVGPNGSGKSNLLEVLAAIFYHLDCIYLPSKPDGFDRDEEHPKGFDATDSQPDAFELKYLIQKWLDDDPAMDRSPAWGSRPFEPLAGSPPFYHITIYKKRGKRPSVLLRNWLADDEPEIELDRFAVPSVLPELVVGYSSGDNEILSLPFFKMRFLHYDEYLHKLSEQLPYQQPTGRLLYLDTPYSEAVLLANYLMQPPAVMQPVYDLIGIEGVAQFRLVIRDDYRVPVRPRAGQLQAGVGLMVMGASETGETVALTSALNTVIDQFSRCATVRNLFLLSDNEDDMLKLDFTVDAACRAKFRKEFGDPLTLFRAFQVLLTLNLFEVETSVKQAVYQSNSLDVAETVPTLPANRRIARFENVLLSKRDVGNVPTKALSDGEHQFLHSMGVCLLLKDTRSLLLLDEPETHFNPDWRARFISTLTRCLTAGSGAASVSELLITSHSPFIVSDCQRNNVLIFERGALSPKRPDFNTFGASINQISLKVFGKRETIAAVAMETLTDLEQAVRSGDKSADEARDATDALGDSVEKLLFLKFVDQFQDSHQ
jgi:restriction system-associated AAA family ATPase